MKKQLVIIMTDGEIELAMLVEAGRLTDTRRAVAEAREKYYKEGCHLGLFDDVLAETMEESGIDFKIVEHEEI